MSNLVEKAIEALEIAKEIAIKRLEFEESESKSPTHVQIPGDLRHDLYNLPIWSEAAAGIIFNKDMHIHGMRIIWDDDISHIEVSRSISRKERIATITLDIIREEIYKHTTYDPNFILKEIAIPMEIEEMLSHLPPEVLGQPMYIDLSKGVSLREILPTLYGYEITWDSEDLELKGGSNTEEIEVVSSLTLGQAAARVEARLEKR